VSHITDALNLSKGTFYLYFKDKNDLLVAVFSHLMEELAKSVIENENDIFVRMVKRGESYVEFYKKYHKIFNIIRAESIESKIGLQLSVRAIYQKIMEPLIRDIKAGQDKGLFPTTSIDPELVSYMIMGALDFLCYRLLLDDKKSTGEIVDTVRQLHLFLNLLFGPGEKN
jgi:AcrR family transcriptional regulator